MENFDAMAEMAMFPHLDTDEMEESNQEMSEEYCEYLEENDLEDTDDIRRKWLDRHLDPEANDWANGWGRDGDVDGDALASAGLGTDEDYGYFGGDDF